MRVYICIYIVRRIRNLICSDQKVEKFDQFCSIQAIATSYEVMWINVRESNFRRNRLYFEYDATLYIRFDLFEF